MLTSQRSSSRSPLAFLAVWTLFLAMPGRVPAQVRAPSPEEKAKIDQAVLRGVAYLKAVQTPQGVWLPAMEGGEPFLVGRTSLAALTLLECGVPPQDASIQKALAFIKQNWANVQKTYDLSVAILFLDRLGARRDKQLAQLVQVFALRLIAGQTMYGGWSYDCPPLAGNVAQAFFATLQNLEKNPAATRIPPAFADYTVMKNLQQLMTLKNEGETGTTDNSNTQFAIMALWVAQNYAIPLKRTLYLAGYRFRKTQNKNGSWSYEYIPGDFGSETMTCAGLLGLAISYGITQQKAPQKDQQILRALEYLGKNLEKPSPDGGVPTQDHAQVNYYLLWSVERVGVLFELATIGGKDWYAWGVKQLLANQGDKGQWINGQYPGADPIVNTCFALLFLKQVNLVADLTEKLPLNIKRVDVDIKANDPPPNGTPSARDGGTIKDAGAINESPVLPPASQTTSSSPTPAAKTGFQLDWSDKRVMGIGAGLAGLLILGILAMTLKRR
ncbi:MAG: hypothetical protein KatS3mg105_0794 [Gemmatales bacterium]|nr:MAG: hypothetical protein KatS3mg105_0794 [Gemmatales bacterium]